jgi:hypothetical protein
LDTAKIYGSGYMSFLGDVDPDNEMIRGNAFNPLTTNRLEDQELAVLSLHLLQNCLVYINTIMLQSILSDRKWFDMMTPEDLRALTPLIYTHVNPYGTFRLNMKERLPLEEGVLS